MKQLYFVTFLILAPELFLLLGQELTALAEAEYTHLSSQIDRTDTFEVPGTRLPLNLHKQLLGPFCHQGYLLIRERMR